LRFAQSENFSVVDAAPGVKAAANDRAIANQHGADGGIRTARTFALARQFQRFEHGI
jgi:hypothetical protein